MIRMVQPSDGVAWPRAVARGAAVGALLAVSALDLLIAGEVG